MTEAIGGATVSTAMAIACLSCDVTTGNEIQPRMSAGFTMGGRATRNDRRRTKVGCSRSRLCLGRTHPGEFRPAGGLAAKLCFALATRNRVGKPGLPFGLPVRPRQRHSQTEFGNRIKIFATSDDFHDSSADNTDEDGNSPLCMKPLSNPCYPCHPRLRIFSENQGTNRSSTGLPGVVLSFAMELPMAPKRRAGHSHNRDAGGHKPRRRYFGGWIMSANGLAAESSLRKRERRESLPSRWKGCRFSSGPRGRYRGRAMPGYEKIGRTSDDDPGRSLGARIAYPERRTDPGHPWIFHLRCRR